MRIYWYVPNPHRTANAVTLNTLRPGDELVVQALPSLRGEHFGSVAEYEVVRDLPDPSISVDGPLGRQRRHVRLAAGRSRARRRLLRRGFDVAHLGTLAPRTDWADISSISRCAALVSTVHDVRPHRRFRSAAIERRVLRHLYQRAGELIVFHNALADELSQDFGVAPDRIHVLPLPLDTSVRRDELASATSRPEFLLFGALRENKGVDILLDAVQRLGNDLDADVLIAVHGDGPSERRLLERASSLSNVEVRLGFVTLEEKRSMFSRATCVLLPYTDFHSQSAVLLSAYQSGSPVIVSDVGAIGPTVQEDRTGIVVPPRDVDALAGALMEMAATEGTGYAAAVERAVARHDARVVGPMIRDVFDVAVARREATRRQARVPR